MRVNQFPCCEIHGFSMLKSARDEEKRVVPIERVPHEEGPLTEISQD